VGTDLAISCAYFYRSERAKKVKIISVVAGKGGSCKTTTTIALAAILCHRRKILVVDADPQGSLAWVSEQAEAEFDVAQETDPKTLGKLRNLSDYQALICDTPPGLSGQSLALIVKLSDYVILPTTISPLDIRELTRTIHQIVLPVGNPYRVLLSRVDARRINEAQDIQAELTSKGIPVFKSIIRNRVANERAIVEGKLITQYKGSGGKQAAEDFQAVAKELLKDLGGFK
jgi:chromosome partitioning protein